LLNDCRAVAAIKTKPRGMRGASLTENGRALQVGDDVGENVADGRAKQGQDDNHDNGDQDENERILDQALTFFTREVHHDDFSLGIDKVPNWCHHSSMPTGIDQEYACKIHNFFSKVNKIFGSLIAAMQLIKEWFKM
jgi:hypothetical protein